MFNLYLGILKTTTILKDLCFVEKKVEIELGLLAITQNIRKKAA